MPRKDAIHEAVRNALLKDGWTITDDPYHIQYEEVSVFADLRVERSEVQGLIRRALVIEIKGFSGLSPMHQLEEALGQYQIYRSYLRDTAPEERVYLAVDSETYDTLFVRRAFRRIVEDYQMSLLVVDMEEEEVARWID